MSSWLRIAVLAPVDGRAERLIDLLDGITVDVDLIVTPMEAAHPSALDSFTDMARKHNAFVVGNATFDHQTNVSMLLDRNGSEVGRYVKSHKLPYESYQLGDELPVFDTPIGRIGMIAGSDHYFPEIMEVMALKGADMIAWSQKPETVRDTSMAETKMRARAIDNNVFVICADYAPSDEYRPSFLTAHRYGKPTGRSYVINPVGDMIGATSYESGVAIAVTPPRHARNLWHNIRGITDEVKGRVWQPICEPADVDELPTPQSKIKLAMTNPEHESLYGFTDAGKPTNQVNPDYLLPLVEQACATRADLVALGEYFGVTDWFVEQLAGMARDHHCYISLAGYGAGPPYEGLLLDPAGRIAGRYPVVSDGAKGVPVFDTSLGRIGFKVCRDIKQQELDRLYGLKGVDLLLWPTMSSGPSGELLLAKNRGRTIDNGFYLVSTNVIASDPALRSYVVDPYGQVLFATPFYEPGVFTCEFALCKQGWFNPEKLVDGFLTGRPEHRGGMPEKIPAFEHNFRRVLGSCRRPELYETIIKADRSAHARENTPRSDAHD